MFNQAFAVLGEDRGYPDGIVHGQANEPAKQEVVLSLLHELALRAHAVEDLKEHGTQQFLGGDAGAPALDVFLVHAAEQGIHLQQSCVDHHTDGAQGMICRNKIIEVAHGEEAFGEGVGSAHLLSL